MFIHLVTYTEHFIELNIYFTNSNVKHIFLCLYFYPYINLFYFIYSFD